MVEIATSILTISDRVFNHEREDESGPALILLCKSYGWSIVSTSVVNDNLDLIKSRLLEYSNDPLTNLILSTGGTGVSPRDNTPEATLAVIHKSVPGISEFIRSASYAKNPNAIISRGISGIRNGKLIINLPGNPTGAVECLGFIYQVIPHAIELIQGSQPHN